MSNKPKKQPSRFWTGTKDVLKTLISNDACVDKRTSKWWIAIIVALASVAVAVAPYSYYNWKSVGGNILTEPTYGIKEGLVAFDEDVAKQSGISSIEVDASEKILLVDGWKNAYPSSRYDYSATYQQQKIVTSTDSASSVSVTYTTETVTEVRFSVYYLESVGDAFRADYTNILTGSDANQNTTYSVSTLFLGREEFYLIKKPAGSSTSSSVAYLNGKYDGFKKDFSFKDLVKQDLDGKAYTVNPDTVTEDNYESYVTQVTATMSSFFTQSFASTVYISGWFGTGVAWAIDIALIFLMGLMLFLMTRGKNNPFRAYTFWDTQKMGYWAAIAPALLALIVGFIWNNSYSLFFFLFLYGLRIMWMSMHSLSPNYQTGK